MTTKQERMTRLEERLRDGFLRIGEAMQAGLEVTDWEKKWIELLREYEALSDALAGLPAEQVELPGLPRKEAA